MKLTVATFVAASLLVVGVHGQPAIACTAEAKICPNGAYVGREGPNCTFAACPSGSSSSGSGKGDVGGAVGCTAEAKICPNGDYVGREGPNCKFAPCKDGSGPGTGSKNKSDNVVKPTTGVPSTTVPKSSGLGMAAITPGSIVAAITVVSFVMQALL